VVPPAPVAAHAQGVGSDLPTDAAAAAAEGDADADEATEDEADV
jgi:hypothetical protein